MSNIIKPKAVDFENVPTTHVTKTGKKTPDFYKGTSFRWCHEWESGLSYVNDDYYVDLVYHQGKSWICTESHISDAENAPSEDVSVWELAVNQSSSGIHIGDEPPTEEQYGSLYTEMLWLDTSVEEDSLKVYSANEVDLKLKTLDSECKNRWTELSNAKANKATTLAGYGITNAYTKTEVDNIQAASVAAAATDATNKANAAKAAAIAAAADDAATKANTAETNAKSYADSLASNYDAKGAAVNALVDAKKYTDNNLATEVASRKADDDVLSGRISSIETLIAPDDGGDNIINKVSEVINFFKGVEEAKVYTDLVAKVVTNESSIKEEILNRKTSVENAISQAKKYVDNLNIAGTYATKQSVNALNNTVNQFSGGLSKINDDVIELKETIGNISSCIPITHSELKSLRDSKTLVPGAFYRITDYECTTTQPDTDSAGHQFDIVVTAISNDALSEEASVVLHEGDTYFANSNLSAWKVWYTLDNDSHRFNWADEENGKGVIYRMIDEKNNDLPYDFKNILYVENNYVYEVNELGTTISLSNPLEISYSLLVDTDEEYDTKKDVIVEISQSDETPDNSGQDVWVLYKTNFESEDRNTVDYADMFVFVDKYDYNGQTWDRWRKAESDGGTWHWVTHNGSSVCILTEELLDIVVNDSIYRYTFNLEEFIGDLSQADASMVPVDVENQGGVMNNSMQYCYIDMHGIYTSEYTLPINVFKVTDAEWFTICGNHFAGLYTHNTFEGSSFSVNRFDEGCFNNTFKDLSMGTFGSYFGGNTVEEAYMISCGMYNMENTLEGGYLTLGNNITYCDVYGWNLDIMSNTLNCGINGSHAVINVVNSDDTKKIIGIPEHESIVKVAQNSRGEIKIYNEVDLIA